MKKISTLLMVAIAVLILNSSSSAQFYSMNNGSYMTGYGQVYGNLGYAMSVQNSYQATQNLLYSLRKKSSPTGTSASKSSNSSSASIKSSQAVSSAPKYYGKFRPDASVNAAKTLSDLFEKPEEREQMKAVVEAVQKIYQDEAAERGWGNNLAGGMTFFMVVMSTVFHDTNQPNDETVKTVFEAVNQSIDAAPEFARASDKDKNTLNNMLVGFSALPFLTYIEGKKAGNSETVKTARILAGEMIKMVLKTDPQNVRFDNETLMIRK